MSIENLLSLGKTFEPTDRDWSEDFKHENGQYSNKCLQCGVFFIGYKRRTLCKKCHMEFRTSGTYINVEINYE